MKLNSRDNFTRPIENIYNQASLKIQNKGNTKINTTNNSVILSLNTMQYISNELKGSNNLSEIVNCFLKRRLFP